jgi:DNA-binding response OmpR family regulator
VSDNKTKKHSPGAKRILVVEDEPAITEVCRRILVSEGFEVDVAGNGSIAQTMLEKQDYDLLLIDIRTPVMNGRELYSSIVKRQPELANHVIFTTGDLLTGGTRAFLDESGRPFLSKPFTPDELKAVVTQVLRGIGGSVPGAVK